MASFSIKELMKKSVQSDEIFNGKHLTTSEIIEQFPDGIFIDDVYEFCNAEGEFIIAYGFTDEAGERYYAYAGEVLKRGFAEIAGAYNKPLNDCRTDFRKEGVAVKLYNDTTKKGRGFTNVMYL